MNRAEIEARGLYDPEAANADERLELLEWLAGRGASVDQMVDANERGQLIALAGDLARAGSEPRLTMAEIAGRSEVPVGLVARAWQAAGFPPPDPDAAIFLSGDVALFRTLGLATALFGVEPSIQLARVMGAAMAQVAESATSLFLVNVEGPMLEAADSEIARAQSQLEAIERAEGLSEVLGVLVRHHIDEAVRRSRLARESGLDVEKARLAIAFVDLVGFTSLSRELSTRELASVVNQFEARANDLVTNREGRVVKLIGDEVMFVTLAPADACAIALDLCGFVDDHPILPAARGAVAAGALIAQGGDYYGPLVNLASRAVELAEPGSVLVTDEVRRASGRAGLRFTTAGPCDLRGFNQPVALYRVTAS